MKSFVCLLFVTVAFCVSSCTKNTVNDNANPIPSRSESNITRTPKTNSYSNSMDIVGFDGKNHIKKNGWMLPSRKKRYVENRRVSTMSTEEGKEIEVINTDCTYETPWTYSQDFHYEGMYAGGDLNYLKGNFESPYFTQYSFKGKVFMYSIFAKEHRTPRPSNSDSPEERFIYLIADYDGDGIFETLLYNVEMKVPTWVLK
jgi:hypothetical protein